MPNLKSHKFRIYPTASQEAKLAQFFGAKRWIFNHYLHENKERFVTGKKRLNNIDINYEITKLKQLPETEWLKEVDSILLQNASEDLDTAYKNFFDSITGKRKGPKVSIPKFKSKYDKQSYRTRGVKVDFDSNFVVIPKIKKIKAVIHQKFTGTIKSATISRNSSGEYYISILVEEEINLLPSTGREVGIDLGLKDLLILSNGIKFQSPKQMLAKTTLILKKQQRKLSRMSKGSSNYKKQKIKVAKAYQRISNIRNAYYHEISSFLVNNFDAIYMENLNVSGMLKNHKLARAIQEASWSTLSNMINYKCGWYGKTFYKIGRFVASSKTCSCCGHKLDTLKLSMREWTCSKCGTEHDRDLNAAINIKNFGQVDVYDRVIPSDAIAEAGVNIPKALMKRTSKIERSNMLLVSSGIEQAVRSLFKNLDVQ